MSKFKFDSHHYTMHIKFVACYKHKQIKIEIHYTLFHLFKIFPYKVLPSSTTIFQSGNDKDTQTSPTVIYVQEGSSASISCQSIGSRPAVELTWRIDDPVIPPGSISRSKTQNAVDGSLFDTFSTYKFHLYRKYQGLILWCFVYLSEDFIERHFVTISTYAPPDEVVMTLPAELKEGIEGTVICKAANGYPAPRIYWYIGSTNMLDPIHLLGSSSVNTRRHLRLSSLPENLCTSELDIQI
ncbi:cell adhesion molecule 3-like [Lytechinus variegatus]|uniref:cell adhesion molecule 3-like n=1 Tax=Lytechinus variegatus TaxID=7654 RepID=UPI001BB16696|nr:cell adhesion molecule 3-like [Lytechinus variegatus]